MLFPCQNKGHLLQGVLQFSMLKSGIIGGYSLLIIEHQFVTISPAGKKKHKIWKIGGKNTLNNFEG